MSTVCNPTQDTKLERGTVSVGKITLSNEGSTVGIVKNSRHDRVSDVSGSGKSSASGSLNVYRGNGYGNYSSSATFSISTRIDTRHEFWVDNNGCETQFVFPVSIPVADGQQLTVTQLSLEDAKLESQVLAFIFDNQSSRKKFIYLVESNSLTECTEAQPLFGQLRDVLFEKAYGAEDDFLEAHPPVKDEWVKHRVETAPHEHLVAIKLFLLCIQYAIPLLCLLWAWGRGFSAVLIATVAGLFVGKLVGGFALRTISSVTGYGARALDNSHRKSKLVFEHYDKMLGATLSKLLRA